MSKCDGFLLIYFLRFTKHVIKVTSNYHGISLLSTSKKLSNILLSRLSLYVLGMKIVGFSVTDQLLIDILHLSDTGEK
jgi:hypothetical protein